MQQVTTLRTARRSFSLKEWTDAKRKPINLWLSTPSQFYTQICEFGKKTPKILPIQKTFLSLPCQNNSCGTDTAESSRQFLYPQTLESNTAAPRRVSGNAPGSPAFETLTTRSAASLCQKSNVMATTINANRTAQRAFTLKEWTDAKRKSLNLWLSTPSKFYSQICEFGKKNTEKFADSKNFRIFALSNSGA